LRFAADVKTSCWFDRNDFAEENNKPELVALMEEECFKDMSKFCIATRNDKAEYSRTVPTPPSTAVIASYGLLPTEIEAIDDIAGLCRLKVLGESNRFWAVVLWFVQFRRQTAFLDTANILNIVMASLRSTTTNNNENSSHKYYLKLLILYETWMLRYSLTQSVLAMDGHCRKTHWYEATLLQGNEIVMTSTHAHRHNYFWSVPDEWIRIPGQADLWQRRNHGVGEDDDDWFAQKRRGRKLAMNARFRAMTKIPSQSPTSAMFRLIQTPRFLPAFASGRLAVRLPAVPFQSSRK
jgi:hypothetical protein